MIPVYKGQTRKYGFAIDWWAFGIVIYELTSGRAPFLGRNIDHMFRKILYDNPPFSRELFSKELQSLLQGLLQKKPARRSCSMNVQHVRDHPFFLKLDLGKCLAKGIPPPYVPPATYRGESNVRGLEAKDSQCLDVKSGPESLDSFDRFTYCETCELVLPTPSSSEEGPKSPLQSVPLVTPTSLCIWAVQGLQMPRALF